MKFELAKLLSKMCRLRLRRATKEDPVLIACRNWSISMVMKPATDLTKLFEISVWVDIMKTSWSRRYFFVSQLNRVPKKIPVDIKFVCKIWTINIQFRNRSLLCCQEQINLGNFTCSWCYSSSLCAQWLTTN